MKRITGILLLLGLAVGASAQEHKFSLKDCVKHLDLGVTLNTAGIGIDAAVPVGDYVRLRTGVSYMPKFNLKSSFPVQFNNMENTSDRMRRIQNMMYDLAGCRIGDAVDMNMQPTWFNFKMLVDVMPIPNNKHWHATLGFYLGPSKIGEAFNVTEDAPTLIAASMFNHIYMKSYMGESLVRYEDGNGKILTADLPAEFRDQFAQMGMVGMPLGKFDDGDQAIMLPDENSMAKATMEVNNFRPYLGIGYNTAISKDERFKLSVDLGVMFWGGAPHVYVGNVYKTNFAKNGYDLVYWDDEALDEEGMPGAFVYTEPQTIDLTRDVSNIGGKVGDMVKIVKKFKCYPMLGVTLSYSIF